MICKINDLTRSPCSGPFSLITYTLGLCFYSSEKNEYAIYSVFPEEDTDSLYLVSTYYKDAACTVGDDMEYIAYPTTCSYGSIWDWTQDLPSAGQTGLLVQYVPCCE